MVNKKKKKKKISNAFDTIALSDYRRANRNGGSRVHLQRETSRPLQSSLHKLCNRETQGCRGNSPSAVHAINRPPV